MIIDTFLFSNEPEILEIRLNYLNEIVDYFVIVEANKTHTLTDKPFNFELNKERYIKFFDKIVYWKLNDYANHHSLAMIQHQRNQILRALDTLNLSDNDIIMLSDVDEVPKVETIKNYAQNPPFTPRVFSQIWYAYFLNLRMGIDNGNWRGTCISNYDTFKNFTPTGIRDRVRDYNPPLENAGWHFSWLGGAENVLYKINNYNDPADKSRNPTSLEEMKQLFYDSVIKNKRFITKWYGGLENSEWPLHEVPMTEEFYPKYLLENLAKYEQFILKNK